MNLLIIEDDEKILEYIKNGFIQNGFNVDVAQNGNEGLSKLLRKTYNAAVVDLMLPEIDGLTLLETIRKKSINTPVIILSAKNKVEEIVDGLKSGGDDYLTKPFVFSELLERVRSLIRRTSSYSTLNDNYHIIFNEIVIDTHKMEVSRGNQIIKLLPKEYNLLIYLIKNKERVLSKTLIMEEIWGYNFDPQTNVVDVLICRLRNKIDKPFDKNYIHTIRGLGYVLKEQ